MITVRFNSQRLERKYFIIKVSYEDPMTYEQQRAIDTLLETRLSEEQVCSILGAYCKDTYKLTIQPVVGNKKFPAGYYESSTIDTIASDISRVRFIKTSCIEVPKVVFIKKQVEEEL